MIDEEDPPPDFDGEIATRQPSPSPFRSRSHSAVSFFDDEFNAPTRPGPVSRTHSVMNPFEDPADLISSDATHVRADSGGSFYDADTLYEPSHVGEGDLFVDEKGSPGLRASARKLFSIKRTRHFSDSVASYSSLAPPYDEKAQPRQHRRRPSNATTSSYRPLLLSALDDPSARQQHLDRNTPFSVYIHNLPVLKFNEYFSNFKIDPNRHAFIYASHLFTSVILYFNVFLVTTFVTVMYVVANPTVDVLAAGGAAPTYHADWQLVGYVVGGLSAGMAVMMVLGMTISRLFRLDE